MQDQYEDIWVVLIIRRFTFMAAIIKYRDLLGRASWRSRWPASTAYPLRAQWCTSPGDPWHRRWPSGVIGRKDDVYWCERSSARSRSFSPSCRAAQPCCCRWGKLVVEMHGLGKVAPIRVRFLRRPVIENNQFTITSRLLMIMFVTYSLLGNITKQEKSGIDDNRVSKYTLLLKESTARQNNLTKYVNLACPSLVGVPYYRDYAVYMGKCFNI